MGLKITYVGEAAPTHGHVAVTGPAGDARWAVPEEVPVAFVYNRRNYAVMLATPQNMEDFAIGFSLTERVVDTLEDIHQLDIIQSNQGIELHFKIVPEKLERLDVRQQRRNLVGRAGCGVCGLENADVFFEKLPNVQKISTPPSQDSLRMAAAALGALQPLNQTTRSVHAAAWVGLDGKINTVHEDVGRHNALDKLLGNMARFKVKGTDGFVMMSSRCSYEIIEKLARRGVPAVASISGPTAFALRKAHEAGIIVYCRQGDDFIEVQTDDL